MEPETSIDQRLLRALLAENDQGMRRLIVALLGLDDVAPKGGDPSLGPPRPPLV